MKIYLEEYINRDIYDLLKTKFEITCDKSVCECVMTRNLIVNKKFIDECPNLKCIAVYGTGIDAIDTSYAKEKGIMVFNAPKQNCLSVAEMNLLLMLGISRHVEKGINDTKKVGVIDYFGMLGNEITNKTVGFIGIGEISILTAKLLKGFNIRAIGYNRTPKNLDIIEELPLETVLKDSDYIVMGLALNDKTKSFINLDRIKMMKKSAYIINACRGALVKRDDLVYALENKLIKGYASDVFETEPVDVNDPLLKLNVLSMPHVGGNSVESLYRVGYLLYEELCDFVEGKTPKYII